MRRNNSYYNKQITLILDKLSYITNTMKILIK